MTPEDALLKLADSSITAVAELLEMFCPGQVGPHQVAPVQAGQNPLESMPMPAVATNVAFVGGVTGGNLFAITVEGGRRLAAAMMGSEPEPVEGDVELSELELSAVNEAMNQMMASAASATSAVLGYEVDIAPPEQLLLASVADAKALWEGSAHISSGSLTVCGEPCRLVQLVPQAFIIRMTRALDDLGTTGTDARSTVSSLGAPAPVALSDSLRGVRVRVWAELGRARMPMGDVVGLPAGAVVELDRAAEDPVDVYVNGMRFAHGRLVLVDGSDWAVHIDAVLDTATTPDAVLDAATSP